MTSTAIRVLPVPDSAPPYDDEVTETRSREPDIRSGAFHPAAAMARAPSGQGVQGTLALGFSLPSGVPATPEPSCRLRLVESREDRRDAAASDRARPAPRLWAGRFVQALVEVLTGLRPVTQLASWTSAEVYDEIKRKTGNPREWTRAGPTHSRAAGAASWRPVVRSLRIDRPCGDGAEVSAVVRVGGRTRAMALRLTGSVDRWRCTELELG